MSSILEMRHGGVKLKIKFNKNSSNANFDKGAVVEVATEEGGFWGLWYTAVIVGYLNSGKILVEYQTLRTADETAPLKKEVNASCVRPCPPVIKTAASYKRLEEVDAWHKDGWWAGFVVGIRNDLKYEVYFRSTNELLDFKHDNLRTHQEWIDGKWVIGSKRNISELRALTIWFQVGNMVEVKTDVKGFEGSWYAATVVGRLGANMFLVEYQTLTEENETEPLKEMVHVRCLRPYPPSIDRLDPFELLEEVDAWYNDGWWTGLISKVHDNSKYSVYFGSTNEEMDFVHSNLRPHQEWTGANWIISFKKKSSDLLKFRELILKRYYNRTLEENFHMCMRVEVRINRDDHRGSWYPAVTVGIRQANKFLVEYISLRTDDGFEPLLEEADAVDIRPILPETQQVHRYKPAEEVEVWYKEGWWVGRISLVLDFSMYRIYIETIKEELECEFYNLRPHREWFNGDWVPSSSLMAEGSFVDLFRNGTMVEVNSDEEGFEGSWFAAVIVRPERRNMFLVEYQTLKTENEAEPLREMAHAMRIRPSPPVIDRVDPYEPLEEVDAWYNDGWWAGLISKAFDNLKYAVYFGTTNEEIEFVHSDLRSHQEWTSDGKWTVSSKKILSELVHYQDLTLNPHYNETVAGNFSIGMRVEVRMDSEDDWGCWYPAVIAGIQGNKKFLVEYLTLRTCGRTEPLTGEAHAANMRPLFPITKKSYCFKLAEEVEAWHKGGWWVGRITVVLDWLWYRVYLRTKKESLELKYFNLRPHLEWSTGRWAPCSSASNLICVEVARP